MGPRRRKEKLGRHPRAQFKIGVVDRKPQLQRTRSRFALGQHCRRRGLPSAAGESVDGELKFRLGQIRRIALGHRSCYPERIKSFNRRYRIALCDVHAVFQRESGQHAVNRSSNMKACADFLRAAKRFNVGIGHAGKLEAQKHCVELSTASL